MSHFTTSTAPTTSTLTRTFLDLAATMLADATAQRRTAHRVLLLTCGYLLVTGRSMLSRVLVVLGLAQEDWSASYRVFNAGRIDMDQLHAQVVAAWVKLWPARTPLVVVVDATHLPRSGKRMPGSGYAPAPRTPPWNRGIHKAQRFEGVSGLTPPTRRGDCRTIPLRFIPAPSPHAEPWAGHDPLKEWEAAIRCLVWLRDVLETLGHGRRQVIVLADGAYTGAPVWNSLPPHTTLVARCAMNRSLFALPDPAPCRGRPRRYGTQGLSPREQLHATPPRTTITVTVRGKERHLQVRTTGPWLVQPAPDHPLFLIMVRGIHRRTGTKRAYRTPLYFLVNAVRDRTGAWVLPASEAALVSWAWQRWEVETMHRELKSGFGLGDQQQSSALGAVTVTQWVIWIYAVLLLAALQDQRRAGRPVATGWYRGRRWTPRGVLSQVRQDLWLEGPALFAALCREHRQRPPKIAPFARRIGRWLVASHHL